MKTLILFALLMTSLLFGQQLYTSTIPAKDSIGSAINIGKGELPNAIYTLDTLRLVADSILVNKTVYFYVFVGNAAGYAKDSINNWSLLSNQEDTTAYSIPLKTGAYEPLSISAVMNSLVGASSTGSKASQIWIKPYIPLGVSATVNLKIRTVITQ